MQEEIFGKYPIPKAYFKLALPVVFSMVISLIYNMVDTYFIAGTGNTDLVAGVALGTPIFTLMICPWRYFWPGRKFFYFQAFRGKEIRGCEEDQCVQFLWGHCLRCGGYRCSDAFAKPYSGVAGCK